MVTKIINRAKNNHLIKSSAIFFSGSIAASFGSYLFHLFMGRMLSVVEYGELQSLVSIFMIISLPSGALTLIVTKYASHYSDVSELNKTKTLFNYFSKKFAFVGLGVFLILAIFSRQIANYLQINELSKVVIISSVFIFAFLVAINKGLLQGLQKFKDLTVIGIIEALSKLFFGILLVYIGWQIYGAVGAFVLSAVAGYLYSFLPLRKILKGVSCCTNIEKDELRDLLKYSLPVFFSLLGITLFLSLDIILAKHYFSPELAGGYGGISILGRVIYYATGPMVAVMFPITAKQYKNGENYHKSFFLSAGIILAMGGVAVFSYFLFPKLIVTMLLGDKYFYITKYLGFYAVALTLLSLVNLLVNFLLSIKLTKCVYVVIFGVVMEFLFITIWHDNIKQIIFAMNASIILAILGLLYMFWKSHKNINKQI